MRPKAPQQPWRSAVASVRCRSRWRVSVAGDPALGGRFPLKTKAQAQAALLTAIGHIGVRCK